MSCAAEERIAVLEIRDLLQDHLFDHAPLPIAVLDQALLVVEGNARFLDLFGPWQGRHCYEILKGRDVACDRCNARATLADGVPRAGEDRLQVRVGPTPPFLVRVTPLPSPAPEAPPHILWMASDVTEASSLQRENEILFERAPCYVTVLDRDLRIVRVNRRARETFGEGQGRRCYEIFKHTDRPCRECPALRVFQDGGEHTSSQVGMSAGGKVTRYVVTASPLVREPGRTGPRVSYVIEMATDVTALHALEREKLEAERLAAVGQTVAGLAHGLKNMLMGLQGGVYVLGSGLRRGETAKAERGMQMLTRNLDKISTLVKDLLGFSKGRIPQVALTDPNAVAREVLELYADLARKAGVELRGDLHPALSPAPLDAEGMHACLANLVSNAIDACQVSEKPDCRVTLRTFADTEALGFEVLDTGCGMDYEVKKKIFTTFFTTKGEGGTGLGLLLTRKIVQEHGGTIHVDSHPGQGTRFAIRLPRARLPQPTAEAMRDAEATPDARDTPQ
jgi:signal transduction histidine kinase